MAVVGEAASMGGAATGFSTSPLPATTTIPSITARPTIVSLNLTSDLLFIQNVPINAILPAISTDAGAKI
jgi:hypothetical protein